MRWWFVEVKNGAFYLIPRHAATIILYCLVSVLCLSKSTTRINLLLPPSGIVDDVLDNKGTLKFSTRTCWPRVQSDPFWPSVLHIFHWYKKQFSKDKRPSGSVKIIRRQTIQLTWYMTESFIIIWTSDWIQSHHGQNHCKYSFNTFRYLWKWQWRRLGRLGPENNFSRPCELQFGQTIKRGWEGAGGRGGPDLFLRSATIHNIHHLQRIFLCNRR